MPTHSTLRMLSLGVSLFAAAHASARDDVMTAEHGALFFEWAKEYSRDYADDAELTRRFGVWQENKALVDAHNARYEAGLETYWMKVNHFGDMTEADRRQYKGRPGSRPASAATGTFTRKANTDYPKQWNWVDTGIVPEVKDQKKCGSCWAFSAVVGMESMYNKANNGSVSSTCDTTCGPMGNPCCSFSEQEIVDCTMDGACDCDKGGEMHDGMLEIANQQKGFINTEAQYPYTGKSLKVCHADTSDAVQIGVKGYKNVTHGDEVALMQASAEVGVISIAVDASVHFALYDGGVFSNPDCKSGAGDLDHGVAIVGYGDGPGPDTPPPSPYMICDAQKDEAGCLAAPASPHCWWCHKKTTGAGFCTEWETKGNCTGPSAAALFEREEAAKEASRVQDIKSGPYWIVRNSWGKSWGHDGYIYIARNMNNMCGVATDAQYPTM